MIGIAKLWPQDRIEGLWAFQQRARKDGNRVTVKRYANGMMFLIQVKIGDAEKPFSTVSEAETWYSADHAAEDGVGAK